MFFVDFSSFQAKTEQKTKRKVRMFYSLVRFIVLDFYVYEFFFNSMAEIEENIYVFRLSEQTSPRKMLSWPLEANLILDHRLQLYSPIVLVYPARLSVPVGSSYNRLWIISFIGRR